MGMVVGNVVGGPVVVVGGAVVVVGGAVVVVGGAVVVVVVGGAVVVDVGGIVQLGRVILLLSRLTWPLRANTRPSTMVPVVTEIEVSAMMVPTKVELVPSVAELPTCQKTLHGEAPLMRLTVLLDAVINVDPAWKMKTALGSPCASRVTVPVSPMGPAVLYTPATSVWPPRSGGAAVAGPRPAASLYAVVRSVCACNATASAACMTPVPGVIIPGGKPVTAVPGLTPTSPEITEGPVLVTVWPANTAKDVAVPNPTAGWAADATPLNISRIVADTTVARAMINRLTGRFRGELDGNVTDFPSPLNGTRVNVTVCLRSNR
jgi:hypothetical protein